MAVPRHSHTRSKVGKTRMHKYIKPAVLSVCPKCRKPILAHTVCKNCGYYKGREVVNVLAELTKKEKKAREKEIKQAEKENKKESPLSMEELSKK
jgi:large subunit ribosomal protein L32